MARSPIKKELNGVSLLKEYASWIYCTNCKKTIAYLCYVTYDKCLFDFECSCGSKGNLDISFSNAHYAPSKQSLILVKNRFCCPIDQSPLITFVEKNLIHYNCHIACVSCKNEFFIKSNG